MKRADLVPEEVPFEKLFSETAGKYHILVPALPMPSSHSVIPLTHYVSAVLAFFKTCHPPFTSCSPKM